MNNYSNQFNPQYFQQQFDTQMQQYTNLYNQNRTMTGFVGQYVNSYEEVEKGQVSMNGMPTMYVADGVFWIKKFVNGQAYINAYKFEPINNTGEPQKQEKSDIDINIFMQTIGESLNKINERLNELEKGNKE